MTVMVEISNLAGKIICREPFKNRMRIDLTSNPKGIYVIRLMAGSEIITGRICLE
jgi:hypothetical protein